MGKHQWRERLEDGDLRLWRAVQDRGAWRLTSRLKKEPAWNRHDPPTLEEVMSLREVLFRKYQRRRLPWETLRQLDEQIEDMGGPSLDQAEGP